MPEIDLRPWAPGRMVVEVLSTRPAAPWQPTAPNWIAVERISRESIIRAAAHSYWQIQKNREGWDG